MGLQKGQTNNKNGRAKGSQNKVTKDLRVWVTDFLNENLEQVQKDFKVLEPKERILFFEKLLKYSLPTLQATTITESKGITCDTFLIHGKKFAEQNGTEEQLIVTGQKFANNEDTVPCNAINRNPADQHKIIISGEYFNNND